MAFSEIDLIAVVVATVASFMVGGVWYGPLFSKPWQKLVGLSDEALGQGHPLMVFGPAICLTFIQALFLAALMPAGSGLAGGALFGAQVGLAFIATGLGVNYLFARYPRQLWYIDAGFNIVQVTVMGAVLGAWG